MTGRPKMESKLESRLKNLNRIESLLTELKSTAPSFAVWRPLLQAVIELSGEFKQHVEELREKELKTDGTGHAQQNGITDKMVNGLMPTLEPEVSVFDNARSLRVTSTRNRIVQSKQAVNNVSSEQTVNGNSNQAVVNDTSKVPNGVFSEDSGEGKVQNAVPKGKLQITSNIKQLYSIRRKPKMPPSEIVRATATRTRSRSPSPQQLMKAGPWPHTIITKAVIEPEPRSARNIEQDGKSKQTNAQGQRPLEPETVVENTSDLKIKIRTSNKSDKQNGVEGVECQENKMSTTSEFEPAISVDTATIKNKNKEGHDDTKMQKRENSVEVRSNDKAKHSSTEAPKVKDTVKMERKAKDSGEESVKSKNTVVQKDKSKNSDNEIPMEKDLEKNGSSRSKTRNTAKDKPKGRITEIKDKKDEVTRNKVSDSEVMMEQEDEVTEENVDDTHLDKKRALKATSRVSVLLEDISKSKNKEGQNGGDVGKDSKSSQPGETNTETHVDSSNEGDGTKNSETISESKIREMENILANMLKRHKSEEEREQLETSNAVEAEVSQEKEDSQIKPKPQKQCRTKAMLLQRLRQSTSLENLSSYTKESECSGTQSKTDDNLGIGSQDPLHFGSSTWRPTVNVRAFTQPIKDQALRVQKATPSAVCSTPVTRPAPVIKARARKLDTSSKREQSPDLPPTKVSKRSKSHQRNNDYSDAEVSNGDGISVTKSKAYQEFVQGLYETKADSKKRSDKFCDILPTRRGVPSIDSESAHSSTSRTSSTESGGRSVSNNRRRSTRNRVPKYYGPDMFLIDDAMLVNYKVLKPHFEENNTGTNRKKTKRSVDYDLEFLQYEGEHSDDVNVKPRKSRNSKNAFTITSARKNTSAYQMKNVEVRLQKMSIDEEGNFQKENTEERKNDPLSEYAPRIPKISLFGKREKAADEKSKTACDGEEILGKISSGLDTSTDEDTTISTAVPPKKDDNSEDTDVHDDIFLTPGSSLHRSNVEPDMSKSTLLFEDADDREDEKENDLDAAKQLLQDEKNKENNNDPEKAECWRGPPAELHFRSSSDFSTEVTSDEEPVTTAKYTLPVKRKSVFTTSESESEFAPNSKSGNELYNGAQHRRKPKLPKKAYLGNPDEQLLSAKYGVIKYGGNLVSKKKEQQVTTDSDSTFDGSKHDSTASTVVFPVDKDSSSDKNLLANDDDDDDNTIVPASDCEILITKKGDSKLAITAWNDSVHQTFDKAIDLCLRSNKEAVAMSTDSDPDQESLHLQLDDLDDPLDEIKTPVAKEIKSQSDSNIHKTSADDRSNFHFFNKDGSAVGRLKRENYGQKRSSSSDKLLEKDKSSPHVMVNDFSVVIKVMNMLRDFMKDENKPSLEVTSLPTKQHKMLEEICKICHLDVVTDTTKSKLVLKNRASSVPAMKDLAKITSW